MDTVPAGKKIYCLQKHLAASEGDAKQHQKELSGAVTVLQQDVERVAHQKTLVGIFGLLYAASQSL